LQQRMNTLSDAAPAAAFLFSGLLDIKPELFEQASSMVLDDKVRLLQFTLWRLEALRSWNRDTVFAALKQVVTDMGLKVKDLMPLVFVSIAGTTASFSVVDSMEMLGPDLSRARLRAAIDVLGGVSKKQMKELEKAYVALGATQA